VPVTCVQPEDIMDAVLEFCGADKLDSVLEELMERGYVQCGRVKLRFSHCGLIVEEPGG